MEAFSLLKYWRGGGDGGGAAANIIPSQHPTTTTTTTNITAAAPLPPPPNDEDDDEGSFFDLEFALPEDNEGRYDDADDDEDEDDEDEVGSVDTDDERDFDFAVSSADSDSRTDPNLSLSPSDDLFFKGKLVPIEPSSLVFSSAADPKPQFRISLLKSATKFRVFLLGFKKPRSSPSPSATTAAHPAPPAQKPPPPPTQHQQHHHQSRFFTVKCKVEEVPIVSLFTRDNSSRGSAAKIQKQAQPGDAASDDGGLSTSDAKRFAKLLTHKYLRMIKPLYVRVSKRYGEKLRFSGQLSLVHESSPRPAEGDEEPSVPAAVPSAASAKSLKTVSLPARLGVVRKRLGKSRSASAAVAAVPPLVPQPRRSDDSLLQQQDGIQSAIAHCKKSFNATRAQETEYSLARSSSDPSTGIFVESLSRNAMKGKEACT